jgi:tetratricopeptide (TPR) repeat protein
VDEGTKNRPRITLVAVIIAVIAGIYSLDVSLERVESSELHSEARRLFENGTRLLAAGHAAEAVDPLERAYALERDDRQYQLAYAQALLAAGRTQDSADLLNAIVRQSPNDGQANLLLARMARARGDFDNEAAYYHRAIFGVWDRDPARIPSTLANDARLEWIRDLAQRGDTRLLLGELLQLEAETQDFDTLKQVAHYFLLAGSQARAAELYQTLLNTHPNDAALEEGLGQAETADGQYTDAQRAYSRALKLKPDDGAIRHDMQLTTTLSQIDPTPRRLPSREKYDRSLAILRMVHDTVLSCGFQGPDLTEAERILALKKSDTSNEAAEQVLQLSETLWRERPAVCPAPEVIPMLMQKLTQ